MCKGFNTCLMSHTGRSKLVYKHLRQGMSSKLRLKIDKMYHLRCQHCNRATWTASPPVRKTAPVAV